MRSHELTAEQAVRADAPYVRDGRLVYPANYTDPLTRSLDPVKDMCAYALEEESVDDQPRVVVETGDGHLRQIGICEGDHLPSVPHRVVARVVVTPDGSRRVVRERRPDVRHAVGWIVRRARGRGPQRRPGVRRVESRSAGGGSSGDPDEPDPALAGPDRLLAFGALPPAMQAGAWAALRREIDDSREKELAA
jgi:hypothetical protein